MVWSGRIVSGLVVSLLLLDGLGKLAQLEPVVEGTARMGYPVSSVVVIGSLEFLAVLVYLLPRTSIVGAVLLTGYLGGAVAAHLRIGDPLWTHTLAPVYMGALVWAGVWLREGRLRMLVPLRAQG